MISIYPDDVLYLVISAEHHLKKRAFTQAVKLFDRAVSNDERNRDVQSTDNILHRVFCHECLQQIRGIRQKCCDQGCTEYDCCMQCLHEKPGKQHPCLKHYCIEIPSKECLKRLCSVGWDGLRRDKKVERTA